MQSLDDFRRALEGGADEDALDRAAEDVRRDGGAAALASALRMRIDHERGAGRDDVALTGLRYRLATALEEIARGAPTKEAGEAALQAASLLRDVLGDLDATTRVLVLALRAGANDADVLRGAVDAVGDIERATALVEQTLKKKETKADPALTASMRRTLQRLCEKKGDIDGAFFEALRAARKQPEEGLYIDEVFRLALDAKRDTEAAAFFQGLADDENLADRLRASLYNKLGATRERLKDKVGALAAFQASLFLRETKAARKNAERLAEEIGVKLGAFLDAPLTAPPVPLVPTPPPPRALPPEMLPPEMQASSIGPEEPPDITPSYPPNRTFRSVQAETALESTHASEPPFLASQEGPPRVGPLVSAEATVPAPPPFFEPPHSEVIIGDDDGLIIGSEPSLHDPTDSVLPPGEVTMPRIVSNLETASLADALPPPSLELGPMMDEPPAPFSPIDILAPPAPAASPPAAPALPASVPSIPTPVAAHAHFADDAKGEAGLATLPTRQPPQEEPTRRTLTAGLKTAAPQESMPDAPAQPEMTAPTAPSPATSMTASLPESHPVAPGAEPAAAEPAPAPYASEDAPAPDKPARAQNPYAVPAAEMTTPELPPLPLPPPTQLSSEALDPVANALAVLESGNASACISAAEALDQYSPGDPRVLRLAAKALVLDAPTGNLPNAAVALFARRAEKHGDRAAQLALDVMRSLPPMRIPEYLQLWLAGARAAGLDGARVLELLRTLAIADAPDGVAFAHVERVLTETNDIEARDALVLAALERARTDDARAALIKKRIALLEQRGRASEALPLWAELATRIAADDEGARTAARKAFAERGTPEERGRFLSALAERVGGDDAVDVLQELLEVRASIDDDVGAEAAAREVLARRPQDARATDVLIELLEREPARLDELIDVERRAAAAAASQFGRTGDAKTLLLRLAHSLERADKLDEAAEAYAHIARLIPDDAHVDAALAALDAVKRHKEAVALLEEISSSIADNRWRARLLVRAADLVRTRLMKRGRARELLEKALELDPEHAGGLSTLADILVEMGDGAGAVQALDRLAARTRDATQRAQLDMRAARLLEELLLKPEEAIQRYRAAVASDPTVRAGWEALRTLARQRGDRPLLVDALTGLAAVESAPKERAALWKQIAKVERDERADLDAAHAALKKALDEEPSDVEALTALVALLAQRLAPGGDAEAALQEPPPALLEALRATLAKAADHVAATRATTHVKLPPEIIRLDAAARAHAGDVDGAVLRYDELLKDKPDDLLALLQQARLLAPPAGAPYDKRDERKDEKRLRVLEQLLLHHAYSLKPRQQVEVWGDITALRAAHGDAAGARKAARKVMAIATSEELRASLSDRAVRAVALALDDPQAGEREPRQLMAALRLDAARTQVDAERARLLEHAAEVAAKEMNDRVLARQLLEEAVRADPRSMTARDALLDLDVAGGDLNGALTQLKDLCARETDGKKRAALHLRRFRLMKKHGLEPDALSRELTQALDADATSADVLDAAATWFHERKDTEGLDRLYAAQLRGLERDDVRGRLQILERLAQLRRYERRDLAGAVEALEAMSSLDPEALKPREDAGRLYAELGLLKEAVNAWRGVLDRDPLAAEAWRAIFSLYVRAGQGDDAFAIASTMVALELCDEDIARVTKTLRPPFPRWPIPPKDVVAARKRISHPLERTAVRMILDATAPRLVPLYARPLKEFGFKRKDALKDKAIPTSVLLALRTLAQLLSLPEPPPLYAGELGSGAGAAPPFAVLPADEPGIVVTEEVLKGGMTPERAFALGRAMAWLTPHALVAASLEAPQLRIVIEALVCGFLGPQSLERPELEVEKLAPELVRVTSLGSDAETSRLKSELLPALRDYEHARAHLTAGDFQAGVGYTADRYGFLVSTDLAAAVRVIKSGSVGAPSIGARLAVKELVLFSASAAYLSLRKELGLALPDAAAVPLLELD